MTYNQFKKDIDALEIPGLSCNEITSHVASGKYRMYLVHNMRRISDIGYSYVTQDDDTIDNMAITLCREQLLTYAVEYQGRISPHHYADLRDYLDSLF